jgi:hypothetical protein
MSQVSTEHDDIDAMFDKYRKRRHQIEQIVVFLEQNQLKDILCGPLNCNICISRYCLYIHH